ncbi:hypothetical protein N7486_004128 [Penicillium sp. IBT 16267x]|nr:hypothetical protein N7486_004128 [Penicillium sp. IBT 16267x]
MSIQQSQPILRKCSVVSSFIFDLTRESPQVALFKRSNRVTTYQHHLAPISGSIEPHESPVRAAWRELHEETTLTQRNVALMRQGKPFSFSDQSIGRQWTIYPFAFQLTLDDGFNGKKEIHIDWEHEDWGWYNPAEVMDKDNFGCVPRLAESLRRVWFEVDMNAAASGALESGLKQLKADHRSGSHEVASIALTAFRDVLFHLRSDANWWEAARMAAWHLWKNGRESMGAATLNAFLGVLADIEAMASGSLESEPVWDRILAVVDHHLETRRSIPSRIKRSFVVYLQKDFIPTAQSRSQQTLTILTLSASSTIRDSILDAFASLSLSRLDLRILESRPLFEGASMASSLLSEFQTKFPPSSGRHLILTLYTDASAALAAVNVDFVLLGADRISNVGWVSNKTGSLPAVLSAKHASPRCKALVFSGIEKVAQPEAGHDDELEENDGLEVMAAWTGSGAKHVNALEDAIGGISPVICNYTVEVKNVCFEWVPANLLDGYICETGTLDVTCIERKAHAVKNQADKYFGSL